MWTRRTMWVFGWMAALAAIGCVLRTEHKIDAHIVVDIRHVEAQADDFYDVVSGKADAADLEVKPKSSSSLLDSGRIRLAAVLAVFDPSGSAEAADIKVTEKQKQILLRMRGRFEELTTRKSEGCAGESNKGLVEYRKCEKAEKDAELKKKIDVLLKAENDDRTALYAEIAREQGNAAAAGAVAKVWAEKFRNEAKAGQWIQAPDGADDLKKFLDSEKGKKLGKAKAGEWVKVP